MYSSSRLFKSPGRDRSTRVDAIKPPEYPTAQTHKKLASCSEILHRIIRVRENLGYLASSGKSAYLHVTNVIFFIVMVAINALAGSTMFLNGKLSGEISDLYPTLITPAGLARAS